MTDFETQLWHWGSKFELIDITPTSGQATQFSVRSNSGQYPLRNPRRVVVGSPSTPTGRFTICAGGAGQFAKEFLCTKQLNAHPEVKSWVRDIERVNRTSFWLPTSMDYFYPDFVSELTDGRPPVLEYKKRGVGRGRLIPRQRAAAL